MKFYNRKTKTQPTHLHVPGSKPDPQRREWLHECSNLIDYRREEQRINVVTWSTYKRGSTLIEQNAERWGVRCVLAGRVLGYGKFRLLEKIGMALLVLEQADRLLPHPYTVFSDADDAIFLRHPNAMLPRLEKLEAGAIISANCWNWPSDSPVPAKEGLYPYGNSGGIAGLNVKLEALFRQALRERMPPSGRCADQGLVRQAAHGLGYPIDANAELFQVIKPETKSHLILVAKD